MITLFTFGPNLGLSDPSPFCLKIDAYLRMAGLEYQTISRFSNLKNSPKGKLPYIEDNGETIADSQFIIRHLEDNQAQPLDHWLSAEQKAQAYLITKSLDEDLYFVMVYFRWQCDETWPKVKQAFFGKMPGLVKLIVPTLVRRGVKKTLFGQGISRHSKTEILSIAKRTLSALSDFIGDKNYALGEQLCTLDATLYAFLAESILVDLDSEYNELARSFPVLVKYCQKIHQQFYSD